METLTLENHQKFDTAAPTMESLDAIGNQFEDEILTSGHIDSSGEIGKPTRMQRLARKAGKIIVGEGLGTALEAGMMATGIPLPARELAGTAIDIKTYGPDDSEQQNKPSRRTKMGRAAGLLALNLASGYAMQKGAPVLMDIINDNFNNDVIEGGVQLAGKISLMSGASSLFSRRLGA